jgi:DNA-binding GntR family transcriptional regulator
MAFRRTNDTGESAVERATAEIRQRIRNGELVPGQRLVAAELSTLLDVSLGPLREALTRLAGEGLVEVQQYRGAVVRSQSAQDLAEIYLVREVIEGLAARLAAQAVARGDHAVKGLQKIADRGRKLAASFDLEGYLAANQEFHETIYALAGSSRVTTLARAFSDQVDRLNNRHLASVAVLQKSAEEHHAIVAAIAAGEPARAEELMRRHVSSMGSKVTGQS